MNWLVRTQKRFLRLYWTLNYCFCIAGCVSISAFTSLVGISIWITSSAATQNILQQLKCVS